MFLLSSSTEYIQATMHMKCLSLIVLEAVLLFDPQECEPRQTIVCSAVVSVISGINYSGETTNIST